MAEGFGSKKENTSKNFKTIFERIKDKTEGKEKSPQWYRQTLKSMARQYTMHPEYLQKDERRDRSDSKDNQDKNHLRRYAKQGRLFFFQYKATTKYLPYYDTYPLVYVVYAAADHFIGANLHYLHPKKRVLVINKLKENRIDIPRVCFHKYITDHVDGFLLDLAISEWDTAIALPVEEFVTMRGKTLYPYKPSDVWAETNEKWNNRIKGKRIVKGYGNPEDIQDVTTNDI